MIDSNIMDENEAKNILQEYGIDRPEHIVLENDKVDRIDVQDIVERRLDYPLVAKIIGGDVTHKTELKAVQIGINSYEELLATIEDLQYRFPEKDILVENYVPHDIEFILGAKRDETFNEVIMFGGGGMFAELYEDVVFRKPPVGDEDISDMINSTKIGEVLDGYRGIDIERSAVEKAIKNLSDFVVDKGDMIQEVDINPLVCKGGRTYALDAVINLSKKEIHS